MTDLANILFPDRAQEPAFTIDSLDTANWALSKISRAMARIAERRGAAEAYKAKIDAWLAGANETDGATVERLTDMLKPWAEVEIAKAGKAKHVKLLGGEVGYRQSPGHLEVRDEAAAMAWAEAHCPEAVKVEKRLVKTPLKEAIMKRGEVPDGVEMAAGEISWYLKLDEGKRVSGEPTEELA